VLVNGRRIATLPMDHPARVLAQTATLEVRAQGYFPIIRPVEVLSGGGVTRESVEMLARPEREHPASAVATSSSPPPAVIASSSAPPASNAPAPRDDRAASLVRPIAGPAVIAVVGVASLVVAAIFGVMRQNQLATLTTNCTSVDSAGVHHCADTTTNSAALDGFRTDSIVADVGLGVGVAAIVLAAGWFLLGSHRERPAHAAVRLEGWGAGLRGEF
jgi:hypothetical protein